MLGPANCDLNGARDRPRGGRAGRALGVKAILSGNSLTDEMNESGTTPPDWNQLLHDAGVHGASLLRGLAATVGTAADARDGTPIFIEAWQQALDGEVTDPEAAAEHFSETVQGTLRRMREDTRAGVAALDGALRGIRGDEATERAQWLAAAYHAARGEHGRDDADALLESFHRYVDALTAHQGELSRAVEAGLDAFREALSRRRHEQDEPIDLTELHHLWIESAEPAYESVLNTSDYNRTFARLHNAAMELLGALHSNVSPFLEALGLPSRADIEAMQRQMGELRRERTRNHRLESEVAMLRQEVEALRSELRATQGQATTNAERRDRH